MVVGDSDGVCGKAYFFCKKCSCLGKKKATLFYMCGPGIELEDSVLPNMHCSLSFESFEGTVK